MSKGMSTVAGPVEQRGVSAYPGKDAQIVLGFFFIALTVRLYEIGTLSLWIDEAASLTFALAPWAYLWGPIAEVETNPPGYYSVLKLWMAAFGMSDASVRALSALAGALCVIPLYLIVLRQHGRKTAVIATLFLVISAVQVRYSQEARSMAMVSLLFLLAMLAAGKLVADIEAAKGRLTACVLLAFCCGALPHLHITGFIVVAVIFVYLTTLLLLKRLITAPVLKDLSITVCAIIILSAPVLYWTFLHLTTDNSPVDWIKRPSLGYAVEIYRTAFGHAFVPRSSFSDELLQRLLGQPLLFDVILALTCAAGFVQALRTQQWHIVAIGVSLTFLLATFFLVSQVKPILIPRVVIFGLPMVFIIVAFTLSLISYRKLFIVYFAILFLLQAVNLLHYFQYFEKEEWRKMIFEAREKHVPGTAIILANGSTVIPVMLEKYWGEIVYENVFRLATQPSSDLNDVVFALRPEIRMLDQSSVCEMLANFDMLMLISRTGKVELLDLAEGSLGSNGATLLEMFRWNRVEMQLWSGPSC